MFVSYAAIVSRIYFLSQVVSYSTRATRRESTREELKSSRDKNARLEPQCGWGEKSLLCDPGSELRLLIGGRENRRENIVNRMKIK